MQKAKFREQHKIEMEKRPPSAPPGYEPPAQEKTVVHVHVPPLILGPGPSRVTCPSCNAQVSTAVEIENSTKTHLIALLLCAVCFPLVCLPYCMDDCKTKNHYCPNCAAYLGRYQH